MRYPITMVLLLITSLLVTPQRTISVEPKIQETSPQEQAEFFAQQYGVDSLLVKKIIKCESRWDINAEGDSGLSNGIAQFQKSTFERMEKEFVKDYRHDLDYNSSFDQIKLLSYAISKGWGNEWTAYRAIKNGGTYSFCSKQLKKCFKVYCK